MPPGRDVRFPVGQADFATTRNAPVQGLLQRCAVGEIEGNDHLVVQQLRESLAVLDDFRDVMQKAVGRVGVDPDARFGTRERQRTRRFEDEVGQVVGRVLAVRRLAAETTSSNLANPSAPAAVTGFILISTHCAMFSQRQCSNIHRRFFRDPALGDVLLVERPQVLIHPALSHGARGLLDAVEHLAPPLRLERFPERAGRVLRNPLADVGDLQQLLLPLRVLLPSPPVLSRVARNAWTRSSWRRRS